AFRKSASRLYLLKPIPCFFCDLFGEHFDEIRTRSAIGYFIEMAFVLQDKLDVPRYSPGEFIVCSKGTIKRRYAQGVASAGHGCHSSRGGTEQVVVCIIDRKRAVCGHCVYIELVFDAVGFQQQCKDLSQRPEFGYFKEIIGTCSQRYLYAAIQ